MDGEALRQSALSSPQQEGVLKLIVLRSPQEGGRLTPERARISAAGGLEGDRWILGKRDATAQVSLMNARFLAAMSGDARRMSLAGDNLIVDLDLQVANLPTGARLRVGTALLEVTDHPHKGCARFERRYGKEARELVDSPEGMALRLRGVLARVITDGEVRLGDAVRKEDASAR